MLQLYFNLFIEYCNGTVPVSDWSSVGYHGFANVINALRLVDVPTENRIWLFLFNEEPEA